MSGVRATGSDEPVDVAIITVLAEEYGAVHALLREPRHLPGTADDPNLYGWEIGRIDRVGHAGGPGSYWVVLALAGRAGNVNASEATVATVLRWRPRYVVLVGIAGGLRVDDCTLGDVVVSSVIVGYEYGKLEGVFQPRPHWVYRPDGALLASATRFKAVGGGWSDGLRAPPAPAPKVLIGVVAAGEKVVDDPTNPFFAAVEAAFPKLQAVEMEGAGAASAIEHLHARGQRVGFVMVRGISDMPRTGVGSQSAERDRNKLLACAAAARFTTRWIAEAWPVEPAAEPTGAAVVAASVPTAVTQPATTAGAAPVAGPEPAGGRAAPAPIAPGAPRYDLFLAYPSANKPSARALYQLLQPDVRVFLDEVSIEPGDRWDQVIPAAQRASRATVILISSHADAAWYLGHELVTAIALHRAGGHDLVPVLIDPGAPLPYGLSHVQALDAAAAGGLAGVASRLRAIVARLRASTAAVAAAAPPLVAAAPAQVPAPAVAVAPVVVGGACDHIGLHDRLARVPDALFEQLLFRVGVNRNLIAPRAAKLAERVLDVAQLAAVDQDLCRRLSALLDEHAPWTR